MYRPFKNEDGTEYGSFEVWEKLTNEDPATAEYPAGWYWAACFPGCLPDGGPMGPFPTEADAIADAEEVA